GRRQVAPACVSFVRDLRNCCARDVHRNAFLARIASTLMRNHRPRIWSRGAVVLFAFVSLAIASCGGNHQGSPADGGGDGDANGTGSGTGTGTGPGGSCPGAGEQSCGGTCVNTQIDPKNCGGCGKACTASQVCLSSGCADSCPAPLSVCNGTCVDKSIDNNNCGACGKTCDFGKACVNNAC